MTPVKHCNTAITKMNCGYFFALMHLPARKVSMPNITASTKPNPPIMMNTMPGLKGGKSATSTFSAIFIIAPKKRPIPA